MRVKIEIPKEKLIELYDKFGTLAGVAEDLNICEDTTRKLFRELNILYKSPYINIDKETLIKNYAEYGTLVKIAEKFNCDPECIRKKFIKFGIPYKSSKIYTLNDCFFDELNDKSAYWAGFIAADGCITISPKGSRKLTINLAKKDENHLILFKNDINSSSPIKTTLVKNSERNIKWKDSYNVYIDINSIKVASELSAFNIIPNKTKTYLIPDIILNSEYIVDFIRGYFDGDGCVGLNKMSEKLKSQLYFDVRGTKIFCEQFLKIIKDNCLNNSKTNVGGDRSTSRVRFSGNNSCLSIFNWLYKNDDKNIRFLERKYNIFKDNL